MAVIIGTVNVRHPDTLEVVTLHPGDELPEWAVGIVTNPKVVGELPERAEPDHGAPTNTTSSQIQGDDLPALRDIAKDLGIDARGNAATLQAKIDAHRAAEKAAIDASAGDDTGSGESEGGEDASDIESLRAKATELGIEFTEETTEAELTLLIESKE